MLLGTDMSLRFGFSAGGTWNGVDLSQLESVATDPALASVLDNHAALLGNAGLSLHLKSFHAGVALPTVFQPSYVSTDAFTITEIKPFQAIVINASNRFYFGDDRFVFEPYVIYRINDGLPSQYEGAAVLHINNVVWLGGSYKQDFGISAMGGLRINNTFLLGGSYSLKNTGINELNSPTYEVQLGLLLGAGKADKNKETIPYYSFIDTRKPKAPVKTAGQLAAEQKKKEEEVRQAKEEAAKKAAEAKAAQEEAQRQQEEQKKQEEQARQEALRQQAVNDSIAQAEQALAAEQAQQQLQQQQEQQSQAPEHHETVQRVTTENELPAGNYVIVGAFSAKANAARFAQENVKLGYFSNYGHLTRKNLWYVYVYTNSDINVTRTQRDKYRDVKRFKDAWLLTVEE